MSRHRFVELILTERSSFFSRRAAWGVLAVCGGVSLCVIASLLLLAWTRGPARLDAAAGGATFAFVSNVDAVGFEGDCIHLRWDVEGIREIYLNGRDIPGHGDHYPCVFAHRQPTFDVLLADGTRTSFTLPIRILYPGWVRPLLVLCALAAGWAGLTLVGPERRARWATGRRGLLAALALAVLLVMAVDVTTNALDIFLLRWDHVYYIGLATDGYRPENIWAVEPFVYLGGMLALRFVLARRQKLTSSASAAPSG